MPVEMQLSRIIISEINESQYVFLKEVDGDRQFPILIGIFEATSIDRRVKNVERPRPLTHDLIVSVAETLGIKTVAEGVETTEQLNTVTRLGVDYAQGYLLGHPARVPTLRSMDG